MVLALLAMPVAMPALAAEGARLPVVASFSVVADIVRALGGEHVEVTTLVPAGGDVHVYQPAPADIRKLAQARLVVMNGLGLEGWMVRLVTASGTQARVVEAGAGVPLRQASEAAGDPHAWQSAPNLALYAHAILAGLIAADPDNTAAYQARFAAYAGQLEALETDIRAQMARVPPERRRIITTHDALGYFAAAYGLTTIAPQGFSTDAEPSARDVARLIRQIRAEKIPAVFLEKAADPRLMQRIASESGARIGGTLYTDSLSPADGPAATCIAMLRHNVDTLVNALVP
jgi:zinc/manganese transport system substrate-binding protein